MRPAPIELVAQGGNEQKRHEEPHVKNHRVFSSFVMWRSDLGGPVGDAVNDAVISSSGPLVEGDVQMFEGPGQVLGDMGKWRRTATLPGRQ